MIEYQQKVILPFAFCAKCPHMETRFLNGVFNGYAEVEERNDSCKYEEICDFVADHIRKDCEREV